MEDAKCPKCGEKIAYLDVYSKENMCPESMYFYCSECEEYVTKIEIKARKILFQEPI